MINDLNLTFIEDVPDKDSFYELYNSTGWNKKGRTSEQLYDAINSSWNIVAAYTDERLIGCGRIISDGVLHAFLSQR